MLVIVLVRWAADAATTSNRAHFQAHQRLGAGQDDISSAANLEIKAARSSVIPLGWLSVAQGIPHERALSSFSAAVLGHHAPYILVFRTLPPTYTIPPHSRLTPPTPRPPRPSRFLCCLPHRKDFLAFTPHNFLLLALSCYYTIVAASTKKGCRYGL